MCSGTECGSGHIFLAKSDQAQESTNWAWPVSDSHSVFCFFYVWTELRLTEFEPGAQSLCHAIVVDMHTVCLPRSQVCCSVHCLNEHPYKTIALYELSRHDRLLFMSTLHFHRKLAGSDLNPNMRSEYLFIPGLTCLVLVDTIWHGLGIHPVFWTALDTQRWPTPYKWTHSLC